ncbi:MAG: AAA family ATPase [Oligoflexia bacterium]|nr:AAA family ATPase [Oligoflexia bacterium]
MLKDTAKKNRFLLKQFPVVILLGVRQCGKTHLLKSLYPKWKYFDLENLKDRNFITRDFFRANSIKREEKKIGIFIDLV